MIIGPDLRNTSSLSSLHGQPQQQPAARSLPAQQAVTRSPANTAPVTVQPPGTEVTPLEGMQQMGLTPDPVTPTATPEGGNDAAAAAGSNASLTAGQDTISNGDAGNTSAVPEAEPSPVQAAPTVAPIPEQVQPEQSRPVSPEPAPTPSAANLQGASYATVEADPRPIAKRASSAAGPSIAKAKSNTIVVKVQLASGDKTAVPATTAPVASAHRATKPVAQQQSSATTTASPKTSSGAPVQLLEGHLTQTPDSSSSTSAKQK
jgi:hypothetical protein